MGAVRFSLDSGLVSQLQTVLPLKTFVETGTYEGDSVATALSMFNELYSIELSVELYAGVVNRFEGEPKVHLRHGDSRDVLRELVPRLRKKSVLYWLDAHWCDDNSDSQGEGHADQCPLLGELEAIGSVNDRSVVLIDDARLFTAPPPMPAPAEGWPQFSEVWERLSALNRKHELMVIDDVFVFFPLAVREPLREYARHHAVDWLVELQASRRVTGQIRQLRDQIRDQDEQLRAEADKRTQAVADQIDALASTLAELQAGLLEPGTKSAEALAELSASLGGVMASMEEIPAIGEDVKGIERQLGPVSSKLKPLGPRLERLAKSVAQLRRESRKSLNELAELAKVREEVEATGTNLLSLTAMLEGLQREVAQRFDAQSAESERSLEAVGELPEARREIGSLASRVQQLAENLEALQPKLDDGLRLQSHDSSVISDELMAIRGQMGSIEGSSSASTDELMAIRGQMGSIEGSSSASIDELKLIRRRIATMEQKLESQSRAIEARLDELATPPARFRRRRSRRRQDPSKAPAPAPAPAQAAATTSAAPAEPRRRRLPLPIPIRRGGRARRPSRVRRRFLLIRRSLIKRRRAIARFFAARARGVRRGFARVLRKPRMMLFGSRLGKLDFHAPRQLRIPRRYRRVAPPDHPPRISVVTPSHPEPGLFDRTLRSVLEQGYEPLEYIVEATDGHRLASELVERYQGQLAHWDIQENGNHVHAMNAGFDRATGEVMSYLSPQGMLLPGALPYVARYFESHPEVDVVYGHRVLLDEDDNEIGRWVLPRHDDEVLSWADFVPPEGLFWRREAWDAIGGRLDEGVDAALDWELLLRFREVGAPMARVPRFLGGRRLRLADGTITETNGDKAVDRHLLERIHGHEVSDKEIKRGLRGYVRRHAVLQKLYRIHLLRY